MIKYRRNNFSKTTKNCFLHLNCFLKQSKRKCFCKLRNWWLLTTSRFLQQCQIVKMERELFPRKIWVNSSLKFNFKKNISTLSLRKLSWKVSIWKDLIILPFLRFSTFLNKKAIPFKMLKGAKSWWANPKLTKRRGSKLTMLSNKKIKNMKNPDLTWIKVDRRPCQDTAKSREVKYYLI